MRIHIHMHMQMQWKDYFGVYAMYCMLWFCGTRKWHHKLTFDLAGGYPLARISSEHPQHQIFGIIRNLSPGTPAEVHLPSQHLGKDVIFSFRIKWGAAAQQSIHHDTGAPDVSLNPIVATEGLWGEVECRTYEFG